MLQEMHLKGVGPAPRFDLELGQRLNVFTGDNGLGKTFMLDIAWWALTGTWAAGPVWPRLGPSPGDSTIGWRLRDSGRDRSQPMECWFDPKRQIWARRLPIEGPGAVVVYVRVDGGFSVWDPIRNYAGDEGGLSIPMTVPVTFGPARPPNAYHFSPSTLWDGLEQDGKVVCNGLIRDWVSWQRQSAHEPRSPFSTLVKVVERLSPHPVEWIRVGKPVRVSIEDVRDVPTVELPYGVVPVTQASAGMKRILALAYLLTWTWYEHVQASDLAGERPVRSLIFLMDEVEAHLHPRWQRSVLPALLGAVKDLEREIRIQALCTTHSPLVLASLETLFSETRDKLFSFEMRGRDVTLADIPWAKQGDAVNWLTSEVFGLRQARSREAEEAIEAAESLMRSDDMGAYAERLRTKEGIHHELLRVLADHDPFWARWIVAMEKRQQ